MPPHHHEQPHREPRSVHRHARHCHSSWQRRVSPALDRTEQTHSDEMSAPMHHLSGRWKLFFLGVGALVLAFNGAARGDDSIVTDASGRTVSIADTSRIVSIGGSIKDIYYAIGLKQKIVAVDTTSLYPPAALQEKPNVGYMRQLSTEGVLALSPTLVLALQGSGPKETIDILGQSKIPFVAVPDKFSGD